jgi:hypothetical protein
MGHDVLHPGPVRWHGHVQGARLCESNVLGLAKTNDRYGASFDHLMEETVLTRELPQAGTWLNEGFRFARQPIGVATFPKDGFRSVGDLLSLLPEPYIQAVPLSSQTPEG